MHTQHIKTFRLIIGLIVLSLFFAEVEATADIIGIPDNSYVVVDSNFVVSSVDFTNTQRSISHAGIIGDFLSGGGEIHARAGANLATGELRVYADALAGLAGPFGPASADAFAGAGFGDRVFIDGTWTGDLPVTISLALAGSYTPNQTETGLIFALNTASGSGFTAERLDIFNGAPIPLSLTSTVMVPSSFPFFDFTASVLARAADYVSLDPLAPRVPGPDAVVNFENTARLGLTLPSSEFSFRSESTVLLTQSSTSVPEPSTLLLLGSALVGLATWRRKLVA